MAKVLILYGTTEGQTAVSPRSSPTSSAKWDTRRTSSTSRGVRPLPDGYDAVIIGASIHMGRHDKHVVEFVHKNLDILARLPSAFFSVSLAAHGDTQEAEGYVDRSRPRPDGAPTGSRCSEGRCSTPTTASSSGT